MQVDRRMSRRPAVWVAGVIALSLLGHAALWAAQRYPKPKAPLDGSAIVAALAKLETQQEDVLRRLEETKKELAIVKVRAATVPSGICTSVISN